MSLRKELDRLNIAIPSLAGPFGAYVPARRTGDLIFVAGQLPMRNGVLLARGPVPSRCTIEQGREAARQCAINALAAAATVADIDQISGVIRVGAFVQSDSDFFDQPKIANAASELLLQLFGESGKHARVAVGTSSLPLNASVEIEFLFLV
jgi:enamine deaminase RidA (YjgF/YER057c/UK114 family)